jgi:hypothetical protein
MENLLVELILAILKRGFMASRFGIIIEIWDFLRVRKKWWLAPIISTLVLLSLLIVMTQGSAVAPFIYALF